MRHSDEAINRALEMLKAKATYDKIRTTTGIPKTTLLRYVEATKVGNRPRTTPGPPPILTTPIEDDVACWVVAMQRLGYPVDRAEVCAKAHEICNMLGISPVTDGWYARFRGRYPELTPRVAQVVSRARHGPTRQGMAILFNTMAKLVVEHNLDPTRVFNMDESPFFSRRKDKTALALRGSSNVWTIEPPSPVHISYVACVSAAGVILPPLFVIPGARVNCEIAAAAASIPDCRVTCSD